MSNPDPNDPKATKIQLQHGKREWLRVSNDGGIYVDWEVAEFIAAQERMGLATSDPMQTAVAMIVISLREHMLQTTQKVWKP